MDSRDLAEVRRTLWAAADQLRANSTLAPSECRGPVLGLIFLAYAEHRFDEVRPEVEAKATPDGQSAWTTIEPDQCSTCLTRRACPISSACQKARTWALRWTRR